MLGYTTRVYKGEVQMLEEKSGHLLYGPWLNEKRPRRPLKRESSQVTKGDHPKKTTLWRKSWFEIMNAPKEMVKQKAQTTEGEGEANEMNQIEEEPERPHEPDNTAKCSVRGNSLD